MKNLLKIVLICVVIDCVLTSENKDDSQNLKSRFLIVNTDNGTSAIDYFYDVEDLDSFTKQNLTASVSKALQDQKILHESDSDTQIATFTIKNPTQGAAVRSEIKVDVERITQSALHPYTTNISKLEDELDLHEYSPDKGEDGTNVVCDAWRFAALKKQQLKSSVFVPKCNPDGSYASEQCDEIAGLCWCVNNYGEEIGGTLVKFERAKCNRKKKNRGIIISASGQSIIDIGSVESETEGNKCEKEKRSLHKLRTSFNETSQRIRIPDCDNDDYASIQCTVSKKHCWCSTKDGEEVIASGKVGGKPRNCSTHYIEHKKTNESMDWPHLWKVIANWQSTVRILSHEAKEENPDFLYKPRGVLVKLPPSSGFKKSMIFLPQEAPDNETEIPYDVWLKVMKHENPNFNVTLYEVDQKEMSKYQSIEVPDGKGGTYPLTVHDFLALYPKFNELWSKVNRNATEFERLVRKQQVIDWKKLSEHPKPDNLDPMGLLAAGTFEVRSEHKICFCYNKRYWEKVQQFIDSNQTSNSGRTPGKIGGRSMPCARPVKYTGLNENIAILDGLTFNDLMNSEQNPSTKQKVDTVLRNKITKINPMRQMLALNVEHFEKLSGVELNNINIPARYFTPAFWRKLELYTKTPTPEIEKELEITVEPSTKDPTERPKPINLGKLIRLMSKSKINTKQVLELAGYSTRAMVDDLENALFVAVRGSIKAVSVSYNYIKGYFIDSNPITKITSSFVNSNPAGIPGTVQMRTSLCSFGYSFISTMRSLPDTVKDIQIYFGETQKCVGDNCPTFNNDLTFFTKRFASVSYSASTYLQVNFIARLYRNVPFYTRMYIRKTLRKFGLKFVLASEAHFEMIFQTIASLAVGTVKPFCKIPYILFLGEGSITERVLGSFPAIIEFTGDYIKPLLVITEPVIRGYHFLRTGDFRYALNVGRGMSANYEKNVLTSFSGRPAALENYQPNTPRTGQMMGPDGIPVDSTQQIQYDEQQALAEELMDPNATIPTPPPKKYSGTVKLTIDPDADMKPVVTKVDPDEVETKFLDQYNGEPPITGYQVDDSYNVRKEYPRVKLGFISRIVYLPLFLLSAGGPVYGSSSGLFAPVLNISTLFIYGTVPIYEKIRMVPEILDSGSAFYKPITMILNGVLPVIDLLYDFWVGQATAIQTTARAPVAFMSLATSPIKFLLTGPAAIFKESVQYFTGSGGLMSMFSMQFSNSYIGNRRGYFFRRVSEAYSKAQTVMKTNDEKNLIFVSAYMGLYYLKPHIDVTTSLFNGGVGNIVDAHKMMNYDFLNWQCDPYNSMLLLSQNQAAMYEVAIDQNMYVQATLGGEDPDDLNGIGIDAHRLIRANIDPVKVLLGGQQLLSREIVVKSNATEMKRIGIDEQILQERVGLTYDQLMNGGLWNAKQESLIEYGVDPFLFIDRMMRHSIVDKKAFLSCGISVRKLLAVGIRPDYFIASGVLIVKLETWQKLGIDPSNTQDADAFHKIGISFEILSKLKVNPQILLQKGISGLDANVVRKSFGIDKQKLLSSVFVGFKEAELHKLGIDTKKLMQNGFTPIDLVTGSQKLYKMNDEQLGQIGINVVVMRSADMKPRAMLQHGIMSSDLYKYYKLGVNPDEMLSQSFSKSGVGLLSENEYSRKDNVYTMARAITNFAKQKGAPEYPQVYNYLMNSKKSLFVEGKERLFRAINYDENQGFISYVSGIVIHYAIVFFKYVFTALPFQIIKFIHFLFYAFSEAFSQLLIAVF